MGWPATYGAVAQVPDSRASRSYAAWERLHSVTGLVPLALYVPLHLRETTAATGGREAFVLVTFGGHGSTTVIAIETAVVVLPLLLHAALGLTKIWRGRRTYASASYPSLGSRRLQWLTGLVLLVFLATHLAQCWVSKVDGSGAFASYEALRTGVASYAMVAFYVAGISSLALHLGQGLVAAYRSFGARRGLWAVRIGAGTLAFVVWLGFVNGLSHFAGGEALVFRAPRAPGGGERSEAPQRAETEADR